jgi:hypothetical protein
MKSKNIYKILFIGSLCFSLYACSLDTEPLSSLSELTVGNNNATDSVKYKYSTKAEIYTQYRNLYQLLKDRQEHWYLDMLLVAETHSDNAYAGTTGSEVIPMENNSVDAANSCLARDWDRYLADVAQANAVICNIDSVPDQTLTSQERKQWKAEAMIFRAMIWFDMVRLWGNVPIVTKEGVDITAENIEQVYPLYYPKQVTAKEAYTQIVADLTAAIADAPARNAADKTILSKSVARTLLAKVYAEKSIRDYSKVVQYCNEVIADGFSLVSNYADLFSLNSAGTDAKLRSSSESILEVNYFTGGGNWVTWMFGRDLLDYNYYFTWAKWITPSRDLIADFKSENDNVRLNQSVVYYVSTWSNYYPAANYAFMYKCRSNVSSIIKFRYADVLLLKAEALAAQGGATNLADAATIVNTVRSRVGLANLASTASTSSESMLSAVLHERRLELAFEGQRWFDLVRFDKLVDVMNGLNKRDSGRIPQRRAFSATSELLPVPQAALDINTNLVQNPGY